MATTSDRSSGASMPPGNISLVGGHGLDTDYLLLLTTDLICVNQDRHWRGLCSGTYRLISRSGHSHQAKINHPRERIHDEGEYLTLLAGVSDLTRRIKSFGREPGRYTLSIFSGRELVTNQLNGIYQVKSPMLKPLYTQARGLLDQFRHVEVTWKPSALLKKELR